MQKKMRVNKVVLGVILAGAILMSQGCALTSQQEFRAPEIKSLQMEVMGKITGQTEISPGVRLPDRCTLENRETTRTYLVSLFEEMGYEGVRHSYSNGGENVYAVLKATEPADEYVVLGAHYDTARENCPGANDNGTGVAVVLGAAQSLKQMEDRGKNFIFVLFDQEERGMRGSRAFAQKLRDENVEVHSVHTVDQMGWDEDGDRAIELEIPYDVAVELYQQAAEALNNTLEIYITQERGSDHSAFRRLNFSSVGITEEYRNGDTTPHIHRTTDTYETIDFDYLESTTRLVIKAMEMLAQKPARKRVCELQTNMGTMVFRFFEADAPKTCANFQRLVDEGFYNGKDFYRVVKGHVIQVGGGGETVPAEFNAHKHVFGTLGLGRTGGPESGNLEIYVCLADRPHLDGKYTVFGQLVEGADVLKRIANVEVEEIFRGSLALHKPLKQVVIEEAVIELRPVNK